MEGESYASAHLPVMRIYVGGVGLAVTAVDIEKTFSSLGRVTGVEIVRTNGRSFAYMNFEPTSDKTLAKLFSTYNGCAWKGGKLKLERAKEHYLDRLKREWAEDAKLASETPIIPNVEKDAGNTKLDRLRMESMQLQIYFPKLRKVKSLPYKGSGKHKYSFQRIEVPPLPIHFCDCEEHCQLSETASNKYLSSINSGIHYEKELNIMNAVMNKLFEKESNGVTAGRESMLATAENISGPANSDRDKEESDESSEVDADNLVINIGMQKRERSVQLKGATMAVSQELRTGTQHRSKHDINQNKAFDKRRQKTTMVAPDLTADLQAQMESQSEIIENEFSAILPQKKTVAVHSQESEFSAEPSLDGDKTELNMTSKPSTEGKSWLQKSSWKKLVGGMANSSFSISNSEEPEVLNEPPFYEGRTEPTQSTKGKHRFLRSKIDQNKANAKKKRKAGCVDESEVAAIEKADPEPPVKVIENDFCAELPQHSTLDVLPRNTTSECHSQEPMIPAEPPLDDKGQNELDIIASQSKKGQSWLQKSSWKELVGGTGNITFSITNLLPDISSLMTKQPKASDSTVDTSVVIKEAVKVQPHKKTSKIIEKAPADNEIVRKDDQIHAHVGGDDKKKLQEVGELKSRMTMPEAGISGVCTFMRNSESLKQWSQARVAFGRRFNKKRKNDEEDSFKSMKDARPRKRR